MQLKFTCSGWPSTKLHCMALGLSTVHFYISDHFFAFLSISMLCLGLLHQDSSEDSQERRSLHESSQWTECCAKWNRTENVLWDTKLRKSMKKASLWPSSVCWSVHLIQWELLQCGCAGRRSMGVFILFPPRHNPVSLGNPAVVGKCEDTDSCTLFDKCGISEWNWGHIILEMISVVSAKCRVWFESNTFQWLDSSTLEELSVIT